MRPSELSAWGDAATGATKVEVFIIAGLLCGSFCQCTQHYDQKQAERYIINSERQWAESVASGDTAVIKRILADDFVGVDPKGRHYNKSEMASDMQNAPKYFASNHLNDVKVRFYSDTAVAQGDESWQRHTGERGRFVWTDTWIRRNGRWQIVAAEDLIAPESPP
jgi:ketosteroid isomerase-like protein